MDELKHFRKFYYDFSDRFDKWFANFVKIILLKYDIY